MEDRKTAVAVLPTISEREIEGAVRHNPFGTFVDHRSLPVRKACLKVMNEPDRGSLGWHGTCQIQDAITDLKKAHDNFWEELLEVFVMKSDSDTIPAALEFAIQITLKDSLHLNLVSKMVVAKLLRGGGSSGLDVSY